jgi:hypothetical protein
METGPAAGVSSTVHSPASMQPAPSAPLLIAICCLAIILALTLGVGLATNLVLRHLVQTLPLWAGVLLGFRHSPAASWVAAPCFLFWLSLMVLIWTFLLGISHIVSGTFKPIEVVMPIVVLASLAGFFGVARFKSRLSIVAKAGLFVLTAAMQFGCFWLSLLPAIARR